MLVEECQTRSLHCKINTKYSRRFAVFMPRLEDTDRIDPSSTLEHAALAWDP